MAAPKMFSPTRYGADDSSKQVYQPTDQFAEVVPGQNSPSPVEHQAHHAPIPTQQYYDSEHKQTATAYYQNVGNYPQHQQYQHQAYAPAPSSPPVTASTPLTINPAEKGPATSKNAGRSRPSWLVAIAVAIIAALIAAAVSGIAVWKATEPKNAGASTCAAEVGPDGRPAATGGTNGEAVKCPAIVGTSVGGAEKAIRQNSGLAAIGWRTKDEQYMQVFYQDPDDNLMTSWFGSMFVNWTVPRKVAVKSSDKAMAGTPLTVSTLWYALNVADEFIAQNQMNYLSPNGTLQGYNFRLTWPMGLPDGVMPRNYAASPKSSLSSLWPFQHYQDSDGAIIEVTGAADKAKLSDVSNAEKETPLLALPVSAKHTKQELRLFYRDTDGKLALYERDSTGKATEATAALGVSIPASAKLAGFATARAATGPGINTFVLWQDESQAKDNGGIRILSQTDGAKDWKGPTSDAVFKDADVPTHITCINEGMGVSDIGGQNAVPLTMNSDIHRCFFQAGRKLKQVWYDGTRWIDLGFVPMP